MERLRVLEKIVENAEAKVVVVIIIIGKVVIITIIVVIIMKGWSTEAILSLVDE